MAEADGDSSGEPNVGADDVPSLFEFKYGGAIRPDGEVWCIGDPRFAAGEHEEPSYLWLYTNIEGADLADFCETFGESKEEVLAVNAFDLESRMPRGWMVLFPGAPKASLPQAKSREWGGTSHSWLHSNNHGPRDEAICVACKASSDEAFLVTHCLFFDAKVCRRCYLSLVSGFFKAVCVLCGRREGRRLFKCKNVGPRQCRVEFCDACHARFPFQAGACQRCSGMEGNGTLVARKPGVKFMGLADRAETFADVAAICPQGFPVDEDDALQLFKLSKARMESTLRANVAERTWQGTLFVRGRSVYKKLAMEHDVATALMDDDRRMCNVCRYLREEPTQGCHTATWAFSSKCLFRSVPRSIKAEFHSWVVLSMLAGSELAFGSDLCRRLIKTSNAQLIDQLGFSTSSRFSVAATRGVLAEIMLFHTLHGGHVDVVPKRITNAEKLERQEAADYAASNSLAMPTQLARQRTSPRKAVRSATPSHEVSSARVRRLDMRSSAGGSPRTRAKLDSRGDEAGEADLEAALSWDSSKLATYVRTSAVLLREFSTEEREEAARIVSAHRIGGVCLLSSSSADMFSGPSRDIWHHLAVLGDHRRAAQLLRCETQAGVNL